MRLSKLAIIRLLIPLCLFVFKQEVAGKLLNDNFRSLNEPDLLQYLIQFYGKELTQLPPSAAKQDLDKLTALAEKENLPALEAAVHTIRGKYHNDQYPDDTTYIYRELSAGLDIAIKNNLRTLTAYSQYQLGTAYYKHARFKEGIEELLNANEILKDIGYSRMPEAAHYLLVLGSMYCDYQEYEKALKCLTPALNFTHEDSEERYNILGTIGLAYYRLDKADSSICYSNQALAIARQMGDTLMIGSMSGNIGIAYLKAGNYPLALRYLNTDYQTSIHFGQTLNAVKAKLIIAKLYFEQKDLNHAVSTLDTVQRMIAPLKGSVNIYWELYNLLAKIHLLKKDYYKAAIYQDSFIKYNDTYQAKTASTVVRGLELKVSSEIHETRIRLLDSEKKRQILLRNALIVATLLIIIIVVQALYRLWQKQKNERKIFTLTLENAQKKLEGYINSLREKNSLLEQFEIELAQLKEKGAATNSSSEATNHEEILARIHSATLITEDAWNEFTSLVDIVHKNFFIRLRQIYPDLTPAETRLLTLIKLQFTSKEMAAMLGITQDSIKKARQRARKKINISDAEDLYEVLKAI